MEEFVDLTYGNNLLLHQFHCSGNLNSTITFFNSTISFCNITSTVQTKKIQNVYFMHKMNKRKKKTEHELSFAIKCSLI